MYESIDRLFVSDILVTNQYYKCHSLVSVELVQVFVLVGNGQNCLVPLLQAVCQFSDLLMQDFGFFAPNSNFFLMALQERWKFSTRMIVFIKGPLLSPYNRLETSILLLKLLEIQTLISISKLIFAPTHMNLLLGHGYLVLGSLEPQQAS